MIVQRISEVWLSVMFKLHHHLMRSILIIVWCIECWTMYNTFPSLFLWWWYLSKASLLKCELFSVWHHLTLFSIDNFFHFIEQRLSTFDIVYHFHFSLWIFCYIHYESYRLICCNDNVWHVLWMPIQPYHFFSLHDRVIGSITQNV